MLTKLIVAVGLIYLTFCVCQSNSKLTNLEAGSLDLFVDSNSPNPLTYVQNFQENFSAPPQIALSPHDFMIDSMNFQAAYIKAESISMTQAMFYFNHGQNKWKRVKIGYWANNRPDLRLGQGIANLGSLTGGVRSTIVSFDSPIPHHSNSIVRAFFNGISINSATRISVRVYDNGLTATALRINIRIGAETNAKEVYFSFMVFSPQKSRFASYGGGFNEKSFTDKKAYDLNKIIYGAHYVFHGFMGLQISGQSSLEITSHIDENLIMVISAGRTVDEITASYIVIGAPPSALCSNCQQSLAFRNQCVNSCPAGSFEFTYRDRGKACRQCSDMLNFQANTQTKACECKAGYELENGYCKQVQVQNQMLNNDFSFGFDEANSFSPPPIPQNNQPQVFAPPSTPPPQTVPPQSFTPQQPQTFTPAPEASGQTSMVGSPTFAQPPSMPTMPTQRPEYVSKDCSSIPNTYWTGYRCACRVGYISESGICAPSKVQSSPDAFRPAEFIYKISRLYTGVQCDGPFEMVSGDSCVCIEGYERSEAGVCQVKVVVCPPNSMNMNGECVCMTGFIQSSNGCVKQCQENAAVNGLGDCVCNQGYYEENGVCIFGQPCPAFSSRINGECVCDPGYTLYGQFCSRCPNGQIFITDENRCIVPCGINEMYSEEAKQCVCKEGFAKFENVCSRCPTGYFAEMGFCVTCPVFSTFDQASGMCVCQSGFILGANGFCQEQCLDSQVYDAALQRCICLNGLGFLGNQCVLCPFGINPTTFNCNDGCPANQVFVDGDCQCIPGFGFTVANVCIDCTTIGGFAIDGFCASCPSSFTYDGQTCVCPAGTQQISGRCSQPCDNGQLIDANGICYYCPLNEVPVNGQCQCVSGFARSPVSTFCEPQCSTGQVIINGLCGVCALNTQYDPVLQSCVCPEGFYKNNFGVCEPSVLPPIACDPGFYFQDNVGCVQCPAGCSTCNNALTCTACSAQGFVPRGNQCVADCGDGQIISGQEQCDDSNTNSGDGCSSTCAIESGFTCNGAPSVCVRIVQGPVCGDGSISGSQQCDDANTQNNDGCSSLCRQEPTWICIGQPSVCTQTPTQRPNFGLSEAAAILTNFNNVFILLQTERQFTFNSEAEMRSFMKYNFLDAATEPSSAYCLQQSNAPRLFQCLLIYASGVPNFEFQVQFEYSRDGVNGYYLANVNPLANAFASRSLL